MGWSSYGHAVCLQAALSPAADTTHNSQHILSQSRGGFQQGQGTIPASSPPMIAQSICFRELPFHPAVWRQWRGTSVIPLQQVLFDHHLPLLLLDLQACIAFTITYHSGSENTKLDALSCLYASEDRNNTVDSISP